MSSQQLRPSERNRSNLQQMAVCVPKENHDINRSFVVYLNIEKLEIYDSLRTLCNFQHSPVDHNVTLE
jgi:hypothetical protein